MRICDKCGEKIYGTVKVMENEFDLCHAHYQELNEFLHQKEEKRKVGRPKKEKNSESPE
mgnify:CR=1 FL=1